MKGIHVELSTGKWSRWKGREVVVMKDGVDVAVVDETEEEVRNGRLVFQGRYALVGRLIDVA